MANRCLISYKMATVIASNTLEYALNELKPCCGSFRRWFEGTGHRKRDSFNSPSEKESNGFNLVIRGGRPVLTNTLELSLHKRIESEVNYCQSCGMRVEFKCTKIVRLIPRTIEIYDGYNEEVEWEDTSEKLLEL